jgi:hypothetical protein
MALHHDYGERPRHLQGADVIGVDLIQFAELGVRVDRGGHDPFARCPERAMRSDLCALVRAKRPVAQPAMGQ